MTATEFLRFHGESVLVKSTRDLHNPPVAVRGTLEVKADPIHPGRPVVRLVIDFPDMFNTKAHQRTLVLNDAELDRLTVSERGGLEFITDQSFD